MIPTSVTNSPPPAGLAQNGAAVLGGASGGGGTGTVTVTGTGTATATAQNNYSSIALGLASLILEGRPIADDEYQQQSLGSGSTAGRLSPRPSTSRAAINITTNPYAGSYGGAALPSTSSSSSSTTHQRWTQKLCQLRQVSPAAQSMSAEPELVALAINELNTDHGTGGGDFEIVRRVMLNRAGGGGGGGGGTNNSSAASSPGSNSSDNILHSLQSLATTCLRGGPPAPAAVAVAPALSAAYHMPPAASSSATTNTTTTNRPRHKHGPHCDQFLRKLGLAKGEAGEAEEHFCDMSYVNITCSRWRAYCLKMEAILARREPICIEVYLGPVGHRILLEQWIISGKEKVPPPTMTLPSLCSAIRSQLYFSQIVAWCDLLRKCDPSVYDSGRVIFAGSHSSNNAGDLASSSTAPPVATRRPRLNIFYRIKQHDPSQSEGSSGFSAQANVHHFPHVNIAENFSISVCVKSLPRINGGLPQVGPLTAPSPPTPAQRSTLRAAITPTAGGGLQAATPTGLGARIANCDKSSQPVALSEEGDELDGATNCSLSHRERQLQKYRKRMQRRDKKRERKSSSERHSMEQEPEPEQEPMDEEVVMSNTRRLMISTGTQTSLSSCQQCGSEKTLLCLNCSAGDEQEEEDGEENEEEEDDTTASEMEDTSSCSLSSGDLIVGTPRNKAELLLQAIQRTPKNRKAMDLNGAAAGGGGQNNNQLNQLAPNGGSGCQVCKRQKTQHHFTNGRQQQQHEQDLDSSLTQESASTKLTPNIERCSLTEPPRCQTPPLPTLDHLVVQFKTPHLKLQLDSNQQQLPRPTPPKPSQLRLNCTGLPESETPPSTSSPLVRKALPKVNLTTIFCSSAPITISSPSSSLAFCFDPTSLSHAQSQLITPEAGNNLIVQKSFSAPTLPNSLAVSPRFAKQAAAFYKRRSRHLSDRSDRSSLGSDEQLSDEDLECSPAGSPLKCRARLATQFGGRPLLGNLEESLLQKRLMPKIEVQGFKLLLGASGGFCPTQLTIPAASYFYELHGETLSTPYLCEIRLPRKGYSVPRTGTVQATLLNPMGTVVRMFVIPYDMRDMPPLHRTFIRQRILAEEASTSCGSNANGGVQQMRERPPQSPTICTTTTSKLGHFITTEQMKRLRYSIHLRFQTSRSGRLSLHTDIRLLISRRTDCDTAAAHAKGVLEAPNELITDTLSPQEPRYSSRQESASKI